MQERPTASERIESARTGWLNAAPIIAMEGISKRFEARDGSLIAALQDCSFKVLDGEFLCIVGPSGCGKTTVLRILGGLIKPTSGTITFYGATARRLGMVFQKPVLLPWRTNLDNALLPIQFDGRKKSEFRHKAREALRMVGLEGFEDKYPYELSGGMQQRVAISRALMSDPELLLMDEPFGALDAMTRSTMNFELLRIWEEAHCSVVFVTHSIPEAIFLADRVIVMSSRPGHVIAEVRIGLPRPRASEHRYAQEFARYEGEITDLLGVKVIA